MTEIKAVEMDYLKQAIGTDGMPALSWVIQSDGVCYMQTCIPRYSCPTQPNFKM